MKPRDYLLAFFLVSLGVLMLGGSSVLYDYLLVIKPDWVRDHSASAVSFMVGTVGIVLISLGLASLLMGTDRN